MEEGATERLESTCRGSPRVKIVGGMTMESAVERLAAELLKLPATDWDRLVELRHTSQPEQPGFWQAGKDELTERQAEGE